MGAVVVGTAGHVDHGKTTLLRALSGIDADRLPDERRRGMTLDVGYAHLALPDGEELDFVDVPGHDRLVGNMLVGAGEIDAALLVIAADDGPRAQTREHVGLLDALGIVDAVIVVTKSDLVPADRLAEAIGLAREAVRGTALERSPTIGVSAERGDGLEELRSALAALRDRVRTRARSRPAGPLRLAIDRGFAVTGRGVVVTGSLRGGRIATGARLRIEPGGREVRVREIQAHGLTRAVHDGGRTALSLGGGEADEVARGHVLTAGPGIESSDRVLAVLRRPVGVSGDGMPGASPPPPFAAQRGTLRLHIGTDQVAALVPARGPATVPLTPGEATAILRLERPVATFVGDRAVLRRPSPGELVAGVRVLDPHPPRGISRRRMTPERVANLAAAIGAGDAAAAADGLVAIHGALPTDRIAAVGVALSPGEGGPESEPRGSIGGGAPSLAIAPDIAEALAVRARALVAEHHAANPMSRGIPLAELRRELLLDLRRRATIERTLAAAAAAAVDAVVDDLAARSRLVRDGDRVRDPARMPGVPIELADAMDRLEAALDVAAPPSLSEAARTAGCPPDGVRALEAAGRIVRLDPDLAWAATAYRRMAARALAMARSGGLTPAAFRDATGTSRRFVLAILEDLDRRGILSRTPTGHVPGPRAPRAEAASSDARP